MIQREISGNPEQPCPPAAIIGLRHLSARDTEEHLLRQFARIFLPDDAAQVAEDAVAVRGEEDVGVGHSVTLSLKDTTAAGTSRALRGSTGFCGVLPGSFYKVLGQRLSVWLCRSRE